MAIQLHWFPWSPRYEKRVDTCIHEPERYTIIALWHLLSKSNQGSFMCTAAIERAGGLSTHKVSIHDEGNLLEKHAPIIGWKSCVNNFFFLSFVSFFSVAEAYPKLFKCPGEFTQNCQGSHCIIWSHSHTACKCYMYVTAFSGRIETHKLIICVMASCSIPEHPSRPFLDQTLCEHSGGLVGRAAK